MGRRWYGMELIKNNIIVTTRNSIDKVRLIKIAIIILIDTI